MRIFRREIKEVEREEDKTSPAKKSSVVVTCAATCGADGFLHRLRNLKSASESLPKSTAVKLRATNSKESRFTGTNFESTADAPRGNNPQDCGSHNPPVDCKSKSLKSPHKGSVWRKWNMIVSTRVDQKVLQRDLSSRIMWQKAANNSMEERRPDGMPRIERKLSKTDYEVRVRGSEAAARAKHTCQQAEIRRNDLKFGTDSEERISATVYVRKRYKTSTGQKLHIVVRPSWGRGMEEEGTDHRISLLNGVDNNQKERHVVHYQPAIRAGDRHCASIFTSFPPHQSRSELCKTPISNSTPNLSAKIDSLSPKEIELDECSLDCSSLLTLTHATSFTAINVGNMDEGIAAENGSRTLPKFPRVDSPAMARATPTMDNGLLGRNATSMESSLISIGDNNPRREAVNTTRTSSMKLAGKISRSFFDLTQGSQERLQRWMNKLQQYAQQRNFPSAHKRAANRCGGEWKARGDEESRRSTLPENISHRMVTLGGAVPATSEMEILVDWTTTQPTTRPSLRASKDRQEESGMGNGRDGEVRQKPRLLRQSQSASNALAHGVTPSANILFLRHRGTTAGAHMQLTRPINRVDDNSSETGRIGETALHAEKRSHGVRNVNALHKSSSLRDSYLRSNVSAGANLAEPAAMEHRTLKTRPRTENCLQQSPKVYSSSPPRKSHSQFERILQSIEDYSATSATSILNGEEELPPPAMILPYSGIKPHHNDGLVRPIAFRPVTGGSAATRDHRRSFGSAEMTSSLYKSGSNCKTDGIVNVGRHANQKRGMARDQSKSIGNLVAVATVAPSRPVGNNSWRYESSIAFPSADINGHLPMARALRQHERGTFQQHSDNEYDSVVAEHVMEYRKSPLGKRNPPIPPKKNASLTSYATTLDSKGSQNSSYSSLNAYHHDQNNGSYNGEVSRVSGQWIAVGQRAPPASKTSRSMEHSPPPAFPLHPHERSNALVSSNSNYPHNRHLHNTANGKNGTQYRRASIGAAAAAMQAHITPSPSDSGIVDYETLIRDKENELSSVRLAMEQNEEVLVRVHREKERHLQLEIEGLKQRLHTSQQSEDLLRRQLRQSEDIRRQLQNSIQMLTATGRNRQSTGEVISAECVILPTSLSIQLHTQLPSQSRGNSLASTTTEESTPPAPDTTKIVSNAAGPQQPVPVPRRRLAVVNNDELRGEVEDLKSEISTLRDQLHYQIHLFTQERLRGGSGLSADSGHGHSTGRLRRPMIVETTIDNLDDTASDPLTMDGSLVMVGTDRLI